MAIGNPKLHIVLAKKFWSQTEKYNLQWKNQTFKPINPTAKFNINTGETTRHL